jgi:tRNA-splicing ligase RtcB
MKQTKIYAEVIEPEAVRQFESAMDCDFAVKGALMPDVHTGYSLPIGAVVATKDVIVPAWVGYDIGCGMCALPTTFKWQEVKEFALDIRDSIYMNIPVGFSHNPKDAQWEDGMLIPRSSKMDEIFDKNGLRQLGSLGGGNHFIEIGRDENKKVWIILHSGSRGIGHATASHYMRLASGDGKAREGHFGLAADSKDGKDYITDLQFCLAFALENRREIARRVEAEISSYIDGEGEWENLINRNHNHAEMRDDLWIHRKGATHAEEGMIGVIPGNMRDGSFIVRGKGNPDSLWSSSHGAGRVLGRKQAKRELSLEAFKYEMEGIVSKTTEDTLDESPMAYKDIYEVMALQSELVDIVCHVKPIINIKA